MMSPVSANDRATEAAEQRRMLLVELSGHKSRLVELHLRREEVDREVSLILEHIIHAKVTLLVITGDRTGGQHRVTGRYRNSGDIGNYLESVGMLVLVLL